MKVDGQRSTLMAEINVTPFVDVMLVLLIIFMVAAPMMTQGVNVALPEVDAGAVTQEEESPFVVSVTKSGLIYINDFRIASDKFDSKLKAILREKPQQRVFLRADKAVPYGMVVDVMAKIKSAGVKKLGMITTPDKTKKSRR